MNHIDVLVGDKAQQIVVRRRWRLWLCDCKWPDLATSDHRAQGGWLAHLPIDWWMSHLPLSRHSTSTLFQCVYTLIIDHWCIGGVYDRLKQSPFVAFCSIDRPIEYKDDDEDQCGRYNHVVDCWRWRTQWRLRFRLQRRRWTQPILHHSMFAFANVFSIQYTHYQQTHTHTHTHGLVWHTNCIVYDYRSPMCQTGD